MLRRLMARLARLREDWRQRAWEFTHDHGRWCAITWGVDCDGMHWTGFYFCWTRKAAQSWVDHTYHWADGPTWHDIVGGKEGRKAEAEHEPDTRDRFAEQMGY